MTEGGRGWVNTGRGGERVSRWDAGRGAGEVDEAGRSGSKRVGRMGSVTGVNGVADR